MNLRIIKNRLKDKYCLLSNSLLVLEDSSLSFFFRLLYFYYEYFNENLVNISWSFDNYIEVILLEFATLNFLRCFEFCHLDKKVVWIYKINLNKILRILFIWI